MAPQVCGGAGVLNDCGLVDAVHAPVVVAAGDIACSPTDAAFNGGAGASDRCHMRATGQLAADLDPAAVLLLGDIQYESGTLEALRRSFDPAWGMLKPRMRPAVGNHEYVTSGAASYFAYFGAVAGKPDQGYYSFDLGGWHLISLNSNCAKVGGCAAASPQLEWLKADLAAHPARCVLAFWHHPRFSSGLHGNDETVQPFWDALIAAGADLVLNGHDHHYERFAPQLGDGTPSEKGMREFLVGTGGKNHYAQGSVKPNSQSRSFDSFGVLKLRLRPTGYDWQFVGEPGQEFSDLGSAECH